MSTHNIGFLWGNDENYLSIIIKYSQLLILMILSVLPSRLSNSVQPPNFTLVCASMQCCQGLYNHPAHHGLCIYPVLPRCVQSPSSSWSVHLSSVAKVCTITQLIMVCAAFQCCQGVYNHPAHHGLCIYPVLPRCVQSSSSSWSVHLSSVAKVCTIIQLIMVYAAFQCCQGLYNHPAHHGLCIYPVLPRCVQSPSSSWSVHLSSVAKVCTIIQLIMVCAAFQCCQGLYNHPAHHGLCIYPVLPRCVQSPSSSWSVHLSSVAKVCTITQLIMVCAAFQCCQGLYNHPAHHGLCIYPVLPRCVQSPSSSWSVQLSIVVIV